MTYGRSIFKALAKFGIDSRLIALRGARRCGQAARPGRVPPASGFSVARAHLAH